MSNQISSADIRTEDHLKVPESLNIIGGVLVLSFALATTAGLAKADIYDFAYQGISGTNYANVFGSGVITTGTPLGDGYVAITSITGFTELGAITGMVAGWATPPSYAACCSYNYDNAFLPNNLSNPLVVPERCVAVLTENRQDAIRGY